MLIIEYTNDIIKNKGVIIMQTKIKQWGNSYGVRIPRSVLKTANISENDIIELVPENGVIALRKSNIDIDAAFNRLDIEPFKVDYTREELHER